MTEKLCLAMSFRWYDWSLWLITFRTISPEILIKLITLTKTMLINLMNDEFQRRRIPFCYLLSVRTPWIFSKLVWMLYTSFLNETYSQVQYNCTNYWCSTHVFGEIQSDYALQCSNRITDGRLEVYGNANVIISTSIAFDTSRNKMFQT